VMWSEITKPVQTNKVRSWSWSC